VVTTPDSATIKGRTIFQRLQGADEKRADCWGGITPDKVKQRRPLAAPSDKRTVNCVGGGGRFAGLLRGREAQRKPRAPYVGLKGTGGFQGGKERDLWKNSFLLEKEDKRLSRWMAWERTEKGKGPGSGSRRNAEALDPNQKPTGSEENNVPDSAG